jgi:hypothetical protein
MDKWEEKRLIKESEAFLSRWGSQEQKVEAHLQEAIANVADVVIETHLKKLDQIPDEEYIAVAAGQLREQGRYNGTSTDMVVPERAE